MQDIETRGLEVIHKVVRLSAVGQGQHHQAQHQGGVERYRQRGPPVAALRDHDQRGADRKKQQTCRALNGVELIVSQATTSPRTPGRPRGHADTPGGLSPRGQRPVLARRR
jgi:hypothetical protein